MKVQLFLEAPSFICGSGREVYASGPYPELGGFDSFGPHHFPVTELLSSSATMAVGATDHAFRYFGFDVFPREARSEHYGYPS